jgi:hypothetical protein
MQIEICFHTLVQSAHLPCCWWCFCAQVVNNIDTRLRGMIAAAKMYDEKKDDYNYTMPLSTIMAMHSSVAGGAASTAVADLASALAANATLDPAARLTQLTQVLSCLPLPRSSSQLCIGVQQYMLFLSLRACMVKFCSRELSEQSAV